MVMRMTVKTVIDRRGKVAFYDVNGLGFIDDECNYVIHPECPKSVIVSEEGCIYRDTYVDELKNFDDVLLTDLSKGLPMDWVWVPFRDTLAYNLVAGSIKTLENGYSSPVFQAAQWDEITKQLLSHLNDFYFKKVDIEG